MMCIYIYIYVHVCVCYSRCAMAILQRTGSSQRWEPVFAEDSWCRAEDHGVPLKKEEPVEVRGPKYLINTRIEEGDSRNHGL